MEKLVIEEGCNEDVPHVLDLIHELATYENAAQEVELTAEQLQRDGFGEDPLYRLFVARLEGKVIGMALCYWRYSTWKGKSLFLEDLVVAEQFRGRGIGQRLFDHLISECQREEVRQLNWQVLDWNEPAISFYKKFGARFDDNWWNGYIRF